MVVPVTGGGWSLLAAQPVATLKDRVLVSAWGNGVHCSTSEGLRRPLFIIPLRARLKAPFTSLSSCSSSVALSFTSVFVLHGEGEPVTVVPWNKGLLKSLYSAELSFSWW